MYKNYLSDRSYESKRNVKNVEKALKYELRRCEVEAMDETAENLEDSARQHYSKILYQHVNKLRGSSQSRLVPDKDSLDKVFDTLDVKEDLFFEEELATVLK